ncbi:MAG: ImmA/IrrE family metallo-endopeptidase [Chloroflexota bacterium]|nr:ImmA/IrrE family metallo-endopeptidase [Chloroflexota bacterium]
MVRAQSGPFSNRPYYEEWEIEEIAATELRAVDLLPATPTPIRVDRFIEKRFRIVPEYDNVLEDILGFTRFGAKGPEAVVVSRSLSEEGTGVSERRVRSTLAHETGHMLLHGELFALERRAGSSPLVDEDLDERRQVVLCRPESVDASVGPASAQRYDGRWWEYQANQFIGALLLPRRLAEQAVGDFLVPTGSLGIKVLDDTKREEAASCLAEVFDVNLSVARIRVDGIFPAVPAGQLTL